jgi:ABC-type uncharacterized transport system involved in gliding motility auxiliary subunit
MLPTTLRRALTVGLLITICAALSYGARLYRTEIDITRGARHSVSASTRSILIALRSGIQVTAYVPRQDPTNAISHKKITEHFRSYQRIKPDLTLTLIDPREQPLKSAHAGTREANTLVIEYQQRTESIALADFNEQQFANALLRLLRGDQLDLFWLEGHGEPKPDGRANHDLGEFGQKAKEKGIKINKLNLSLAQAVPSNTSVLVIVQPQSPLLPQESAKLLDYLGRGGNLLWLLSPEPLHGLQSVAELLGLTLSSGTIIDPAVSPRQGPPVFAVGSSSLYARHPALAALDENTVFPYARAIATHPGTPWQVSPLISVASQGWLEKNTPERSAQFNAGVDLKGPLNVASALERTVGERKQRVIVVGSSLFLSNTFLGNGGNLALGLSMLNWLSGDDTLAAIDPRPSIDPRVRMDTIHLYLLVGILLIVIPLIFALTGGLIWWRRRRH